MSEHDEKLRKWYEKFEAKADELRKNEGLIGRYFIVHDGDIEASENFPTFQQAYLVAMDRYSEGNFIIQVLEPVDTVNFVFEAS